MDSGCSTPYMTAPSSPPRFFSQFDHNPSLKDANFTLPPPSSPKHFPDDIDFAFSFTGKFHDAPLSAEDLFHQGKIKPLKSVLQTESETEDHCDFKTANSSPRKREFNQVDETPSFKKTKARSLPPFQLNDMLFQQKQSRVKTEPKTTAATSFWKSFSLTQAYRKWKLKDLLFRSASEGRSTDKVSVDPTLMNYSVLTKCKSRDATASFRSSSDGSSSMKEFRSGSERRRGAGSVPVSAHELHYTVNRAVSEERFSVWMQCLSEGTV